MKIDRLLAMTVLLLNRQRVSAKELAERFEVSTKTIYRDMDTLSQSGIPVLAHQGTSGGFEIMEEYTITRQFLTLSEIEAIVAAVKGINTVMNDQVFAKLLEKVKAQLSKADRMDTGQPRTGIVFDFNPWGQGAGASDKANKLRQAIESHSLVSFQYTNMNGSGSERVIEPAVLILKGYIWYVHAYCTMRGEFRVFRLSRMKNLQVLDQSFIRRQVPSLEAYAWDPQWSEDMKEEMVFTFSPKIGYRVGDAFPPELLTYRDDGSIQLHGRFPADEWLYGMLLSYGEHVHVEQPEHVAAEVVSRAQKIVERYAKVDR